MIVKTQLERKISLQRLQESGERVEPWFESEAAKELLKVERVLQTDNRLFMKQAERLKYDPLPTKESRRSFMQWFTRSPNGLGVAGGRRDTSMQGNFRKSLVKAQDANHPEKEMASHWCPIIRSWVHNKSSTAAHIFPWKHGQEIMTRIFGSESANEMFSINNGILMSTLAESRMDKGFFVIVPCVNDESESDVKAWHESNPKRYKVRVLEENDKLMREFIPGSEPRKQWFRLDGQELIFRSNHRPRARYLYYHYCYSMLHRSHHHKEHENILKDHLGRNFWGTPGAYLRKCYLLAFVEEIGAVDLLDGATDRDKDKEADPTALIAANEQIRLSCRPRGHASTIEWRKRAVSCDD